ncbi:ribosome quality control complex subunit TCF25 [Ambystoma mexicanum]|uniref:ribosome quality control complex subunit TCF25 n=1 Tax=Ambystoma mexicanum TaxID=8296 RepID=UPI0037E84DCC
MSRRALRRLKGDQRGQEPLGPLEVQSGSEEEEEVKSRALRKNKKGKKLLLERGVCNVFELITDADGDPEEHPASNGTVADSRLLEQEETKRNHGTTSEELAGDLLGEGDEEAGEEEEEKDRQLQKTASLQPNSSNKPKKKKKRKSKRNLPPETAELGCLDLENIDNIIEHIENGHGPSHQSQSGTCTDNRPLLYVEHRNLNPETELKKYFGARAVLGDQRPRQRQRQYHRSTWLTSPKSTWPRFSKTGIAMRLLESRRGVQSFTFEHNREYQQVQFKFFDAVESMDPNNIVLLLQMNPYHIDSLLQLSDVCRIQEDQEMARDFIERALFSLECAFHPVFSLTSGACRLDYRRTENRAFYLALFKHMIFLEKRGCPRTALEFCKLILSLDPENDPLCLLLIIDFLSLRAREYTFLTRMFQDWESHRNLSQLPNFAFSVALAYFLISQEELAEAELADAHAKAAHLIQNALIMFPGVLIPLLDGCGVQPDSTVSKHSFFGPVAQISQPPALTQLVALYIGRTCTLWKDPAVMNWLEVNVREVLRMVDANDPLVEESDKKRKVRYQSAPRNIHRHVILSEIKEAAAALPLDVTSQSVMGFDPLPPLDSISSYTRPERPNRPTNESTISLFFRSLLPNFNLQGEPRQDGDEEAGAAQDLNQGVNRLMAAMRDMLANIQFQEPPRDDNHNGEADEDWD